MRWSKLKQLSEQRMADSLHGSVELHAARYTHTHDSAGRGWVTIDKCDVASFADLNRSFLIENSRLQGLYPYAEAMRHLRSQGHHSLWHFKWSLAAWLSSSIEAALGSDDVVVRAMAMTDRRLGKRRLRKLIVEADEHPLIRRLYELRCEVEGVTPDRAPVSTSVSPVG